MKFHQMLFGAAILLTACSTPKYVYHFDHYDYSSGKNTTSPIVENQAPLSLNSETLVASSDNKVGIIEDQDEKVRASPTTVEVLTKKYTSMSKADRKQFRGQLKKEIKSYVKLNEVRKKDNGASIKATKVFDTTVALALVFGVAGIVLIMLASSSNVLWVLGAIAVVIGAGLFIKWVSDGNG
ncbi:MAG TPA: hypothetical protein VJ184_11805 [Chryseolinea sp.]|nr:hypothetical protein [Chryseolinea sp.]